MASSNSTGPTKYEDTIRIFRDLEENLSLFEFELRGVPVWEWVRFEVQRTILTEGEILSKNPSAQGGSLRTYLRGGRLWARNALVRNPFLSPRAERLYWGHQRRKRLDDGFWWDIYCDPIHQQEVARYVHLESPHNMDHLEPPKTDGLRYMDFIQYTGAIAAILPYVGVSLTDEERREVEGIEATFEDTFDLELDLASRIEGHLSRRKYKRPLYRRLLSRIDPDVVIVVVSYGKETFVEVCKEEGVPVVELQHGGFGPNNPGYAFPGNRTKRTFPDYLFTFGEFWRDSVELPIPRDNVIPVGYPFLEMQKEKYTPDGSSDSILFISQWAIGEELTKFAAEYARAHDATDVIVKLHPGEYDEWRCLYPWLVEAPLDVIDSDRPPLYELLASAAVQVGVYSTVIYEGLNFGLDTYLLDLPGVTRMNHLVEQGGATVVSSTDELFNALCDGPNSSESEIDYYFEPQAVENVEQALEGIQIDGL